MSQIKKKYCNSLLDSSEDKTGGMFENVSSLIVFELIKQLIFHVVGGHSDCLVVCLSAGSSAEGQRHGSLHSRTCRQKLPLDDGSVEELPAGPGEARSRPSHCLR